jgi:hypothetical protein
MIKADGINCLDFVSMRGLGGSVVSPIAVTDISGQHLLEFEHTVLYYLSPLRSNNTKPGQKTARDHNIGSNPPADHRSGVLRLLTLFMDGRREHVRTFSERRCSAKSKRKNQRRIGGRYA